MLADGTAVDGQNKTITAAENWKHTFKDLPKFNDDGNEIVYTIEETGFTGEGFEAGSVEQDGDNAYAFVAVNTEKKPGEITVKLQLEKAIPGRDGNIPTFKFDLTGGSEGSEIVNGTRWTNRTSHKLNNPFEITHLMWLRTRRLQERNTQELSSVLRIRKLYSMWYRMVLI